MNTAKSNILAAQLLIEELCRNGVEQFCLCPGSRSTPLALAAACHPRARVITHFDERGAAFFALGYARAEGKPAAVICTSGTAAANFFPAVVEASNDHVPLILLTADRPPELRQTGANQTIEQTGLYGGYVRFQFDLPCPDDATNPSFLLTTVDQAVFRARRQPAGPVHLNCMFREPLAPEVEIQWPPAWPESIKSWSGAARPHTTCHLSKHKLDDSTLNNMVALLDDAGKGLLAVGRLQNESEQQATLEFCKRLGWPVLADITSGLRPSPDAPVVNHYDLLLGSEAFASKYWPNTILHLGSRFVSKRLLQYIESIQSDHYIHVSSVPDRLDPTHSVTQRLECDLAEFANRVGRLVKTAGSDYTDRWLKASRTAAETVKSICDESDQASEAAIARLLVEHLMPEAALFVASSMPIRGLDMFMPATGRIVSIGANRGASGIDGTIASAGGFAVGLNQPVTLLIGDLACLHDLNSLSLLKDLPVPVTVVVLNNHGGGIFDVLPIATQKEFLEHYFVMPHSLSFESAASMFGLNYAGVTSNSAFISQYKQTQQMGRAALLEVIIDRQWSIGIHREIIDAVTARLNS